MSAASASLSEEQKQTAIFKEILAYTKTQQQQSIEAVPDVQEMRLKRDKVYTFVRFMSLPDVTVNPNFPIGNALTVSLSAIAGGSEIVALFEQYRIIQVTYIFTPTLSLGSGAVQHVPIYSWIDQDDDTVPGGVDLQNQTLRVVPQGHMFQRTLTPQVSQDGLSSTVTLSGYSAPSSMLWIDNESPSVKYYGLKFLLPQATQQTESVVYNLRAKVFIQARRPR